MDPEKRISSSYRLAYGQLLPSAEPETVDERLKQECLLIVANLAVLVAVAFAHVLFVPYLGRPPRAFFLVLVSRLLMQLAELAFLTVRGDRIGLRVLRVYSGCSIGLNLLLAALLAALGEREDSHYIILMMVPIIAAAFRHRPAIVSMVVGIAIALTLLVLVLYFRNHPVVVTEYFEAFDFGLVFVAVALAVSLLAHRVRKEHARLDTSIAELKTARDRLVAEEKLAAVGRLASAIAHEVRNPVAMIVSSLALSRSGNGDPARKAELDDIIQKEAYRLERLTTDLLSFTRQRPPERRAVSMNETLAYVAALAEASCAGAGVRLAVVDAHEATAYADPYQVHQALLNLILNAIDATPRGGSVELGAELDGCQVFLYVENTGEAIPKSEVDRIFEPFHTTKPSGSGLGLAIARNLAQSNSGDLALAENRTGCVRFVLVLPAFPDARAASDRG